MAKIIGWTAAGLAAALVGVGLLIANSDFYLKDPRLKGVKVRMTEHGGVVEPIDTAASSGHSRAPRQLPRVSAEDTVFDFGILDPHDTARHTFTITNVGEAPLVLENKGTSCKKCTIAGMSRDTVPPGESATVTLEWNTGAGPLYAQTATIGTNDALHRTVQLRVEGKVRMHLGATPEELIFEGVKPGRSAEGEVVLYSQTTADAEILSVRGSREGFAWDILPADAAKLTELNALWARKLIVRLPTDIPSGTFEEAIFVKIRMPHSSRTEVDFDVRIRGKVKRNLAIYGEGIDERGLIDLGVVSRSEGKRLTFKVKIHDEAERNIRLQKIETNPPFIRAELIPSPGIAADKGLYDLTVEVPPDSPVCNFLSDSALGQVRIITDHPRIGEVPLAVQFAVRDDE